ncbi:metallophosphoesterase family protein [Haloferula sp. A504]|uniref:metallophosphoesterase family protein n=1 Tax=Haloferula sp. A504 TaxID=3373601 RepID=UPI0031C4E345|nr:metallophosphoesterase [Verrucomicrobiaceae bacterium E54]
MRTRRSFLKQTVAGLAGAGIGTRRLEAAADGRGKVRLAWVLSDAHAGRVEDGLDGAEWLAKACQDMQGTPVDHAFFLGDLTQNGTEEELKSFLAARKDSGVGAWHELAGNHEYHRGKAEAYDELIRSRDPYRVIDGNVAWFMLSDEKPGVPGDLSKETCDWLEAELAAHADKTVIVCSHQLVRDTIHKSDHPQRHIRPSERLAEIIGKSKIDLWMCGHEHHSPYNKTRIARKDGTTYINIASVSHAYNTKASQSYVLEFTEGSREIVARRRQHDSGEYLKEFEVRVPLRHPIEMG